MITALIATTPPETRTPVPPRLERPALHGRPQPQRKRLISDPAIPNDEFPNATFDLPETTDDYNEERYLTRLILVMVFALIVPGLLVMAYLAFNPDAFLIDITPKYDFSKWQPGTPP